MFHCDKRPIHLYSPTVSCPMQIIYSTLKHVDKTTLPAVVYIAYTVVLMNPDASAVL